MKTAEPFAIVINELTVTVTSHCINNDEVFHLVFSDGRPPLVIVETYTGSKLSRTDFWVSLSRGRQAEAEYFGRKITEHFKTN